MTWDDEPPTGRLLTAPERRVVYEVLFSLPAEERAAAVRVLSMWLALRPEDRAGITAVTATALNPPGPRGKLAVVMKFVNIKSLLSALTGAAVVVLPALAQLPGPWGALAGAVLGVVLLHVKAPVAK